MQMQRAFFSLLEEQRKLALGLLGDRAPGKLPLVIRLGWWDDIFKEAARHPPSQVLEFIIQADQPEWAYRALRSPIRFGRQQVSSLVALAAKDPLWAHWVLIARVTYEKLGRTDLKTLTQAVATSGQWSYRTLQRMPRNQPATALKKSLVESVARDRRWKGRARKNRHLTDKLLTPTQRVLLFSRRTHGK